MNIRIPLPTHIAKVLKRLSQSGYEAFTVGGCVRDGIFGLPVHDYDIATNALPEETIAVFCDSKIIKTGIAHGTVTLLTDCGAVEITTYRTDGKYTDNRHPDSVSFTRSLNDDLSRRDFTINAMAYSEESGLIDPFGGVEDIKNKTLRCVGEPEKRFCEDSLRILRGLRFAAKYGLTIDKNASHAMHRQKNLLNIISRERISSELNRLIVSDCAAEILDEYKDVFAVCIPEIKKMFGFRQDNPHHSFDVWTHTVNVIKNCPADLELRLAALFHDIGKPLCKTMDENGIGHFYGHADIGTELTSKIMKNLRQSTKLTENTCLLVKYHCRTGDIGLKGMRRLYGTLGRELTEKLIELTLADMLGQGGSMREQKLEHYGNLKKMLKDITQNKMCCKYGDLDINGRDIIALGIPQGRLIGDILKDVLNTVISGELENDKYALINYIKEKYSG